MPTQLEFDSSERRKGRSKGVTICAQSTFNSSSRLYRPVKQFILSVQRVNASVWGKKRCSRQRILFLSFTLYHHRFSITVSIKSTDEKIRFDYCKSLCPRRILHQMHIVQFEERLPLFRSVFGG